MARRGCRHRTNAGVTRRSGDPPRAARLRRARGDAPAGPAPARGARARLRRRTAHPAAAARPGRRQVRRVRRRHALHRRRARAGVPARGRGDPRGAVLQRLARDGARPRLRDRVGCRRHVGARRDRAGRRHRPRHGRGRRHQPEAVAGLARPGGARRGVRAPRDPLRSRVGVWLDPARRVPGTTGRHGRIKRVFRLDEIRPTWEFVLQVATAVPATGAKLSPSMPHDAIPLGTEAQWTSFAGEVLECAVWWGPLAQRPGRSARILGPEPLPDRGRRDDGRAGHPDRRVAGAVGPWLYEPDRAVTQAGLLGAVTAATLGSEVDTRAGLRRVARPASTCRSPGATPCAR